MKLLVFIANFKPFIIKTFPKWGIYVILGAVLYSLMVGTVMPKNVNIRLHEIAKTDIQSPVDTVDEQATEAKKQEVLGSTPSTYVYKKNLALIQVEKAGDIFDTILDVKKSGEPGENPSKSALSAAVKETRQKLTGSTDETLADSTLATLLQASEHRLSIAEDITSTGIYEAMSNKVGWNDLQRVQDKASASLPSSVLNDSMRSAMIDILHYTIVPNYVFDATATKRNKEEAANAVGNVEIHQGEVIVKKGELITRDTIRELRVVGLLDNHFNMLPFIGLFLFTLFIIVWLMAEFRERKKGRRELSGKHLQMFVVIFIGMAVLIKIGSYLKLTHIAGLSYIVPVALGSLLIRMLIKERLAVVFSVLLALVGSIIFGAQSKTSIYDTTMGLYLLFSGLAGALILRGNQARPKILQTGCFIALINILIVFCLLVIQNSPLHVVDTGMTLGFALLSGFLSTVLTIGLIPVFEASFGILSPMKLIELSNPNHPLLRKILLEAPGTYHHSVMVANLAERACGVIGANGLLARVAAYYHDVGKTKRPRFFAENQFDGVNPHDKISPQLSRTVIISHPYDGADILREYRMPKEIIDIAEQHHGTTLVKYFYVKAQEQSEKPIPESEFRYPGPKAQTKEAAVVELADSIEAAVRAMKKPTPTKIENLVQNIFNARLEDGQFDECDLTLNELRLVKESIGETLNGVFHSRIEYPDDLKMKKVSEK